MGRKRKPNAIRRAQGNPSKRQLPDEKDEIRTANGPGEPPHWLYPEAKIVWNQILDETKHLNLYQSLDRHHLAIFCQAVARNARAEQKLIATCEIVRQGSQPIPNPWLGIINKTADQVVKLGSELGLSPSSRARFSATAKANTPPTSPENANSLEEFNE